MLPVRPPLIVVVAALLVSVASGVAEARARICEIDEVADDDPPPPPVERRQCRPGMFVDDLGCWPEGQTPEPGPRVPLTLEGVVMVCTKPPSSQRAHVRVATPEERATALPPGHTRRIERPPRLSSLA